LVTRLFSHIDLRVTDGPRAIAFYDLLLAELGFFRSHGGGFTDEEPTWRRAQWRANDEFFGLTIDPDFAPNQNRIAFHAASPEDVDRISAVLTEAGAVDIDGPSEYGGYYATFCEDPDGNRLEICFLTKHQGLAASL